MSNKKTARDLRMDAARKAVPCQSPCARCIYNWHTEGIFRLCQFGEDLSLLTPFKKGDAQSNRCYHCLHGNLDCFKVPEDLQDATVAVAVEAAVYRWKNKDKTEFHASDELVATGRDDVVTKEAVQAMATKITARLESSKPYAANLFLHDGKSSDDQSGVRAVGRDRSKLGMIKKQRVEKRKLEEAEAAEDSDGSAIVETPQKRRMGIRGVSETPKQKLAREKAELEAERAAFEREKALFEAQRQAGAKKAPRARK